MAKAREIDSRGEPVYVPTAALFELWDGVARGRYPSREMERVRAFAANHPVLPFEDGDRSGTSGG